MRILRHPRRDRPKPFAICRCRVRPHDAANVPVTIERIVVVGAPLAARAGFVGLFKDEHVASNVWARTDNKFKLHYQTFNVTAYRFNVTTYRCGSRV